MGSLFLWDFFQGKARSGNNSPPAGSDVAEAVTTW